MTVEQRGGDSLKLRLSPKFREFDVSVLHMGWQLNSSFGKTVANSHSMAPILQWIPGSEHPTSKAIHLRHSVVVLKSLRHKGTIEYLKLRRNSNHNLCPFWVRNFSKKSYFGIKKKHMRKQERRTLASQPLSELSVSFGIWEQSNTFMSIPQGRVSRPPKVALCQRAKH